MSVTTTNNPITSSVLQTLTDYDLHHSGNPEHPAAAPPPNPSSTPAQTSNPPSWPTEHRRVPPHRPINRELDREERPDGLNTPERIFIYVMLHGVGINAAASSLWRATGGKMNDKIFHYKIGGEW